jgi:hypothetical protein
MKNLRLLIREILEKELDEHLPGEFPPTAYPDLSTKSVGLDNGDDNFEDRVSDSSGTFKKGTGEPSLDR